MLGRLRDCGRTIEQMSAAARAVRSGPQGDRVGLRALAIEVARLRAELRNWPTTSPDWLDQVSARVDALDAGIQALLHGAPLGTASARSRGFASDIGRAA
jgi:hypothetical protein